MCFANQIVRLVVLVAGVLLSGPVTADHLAIVYCQSTPSGEVKVIAIDSSPVPQSPTRSSRGRSCSQVVHEMILAGYDLMRDALPGDASGPLVFLFEHHGKK